MIMPLQVRSLFRVLGAMLFIAGWAMGAARAQPAADVAALLESNRQLQEQVRAQQKTIEALNARMGELQRATERQERQLSGLAERVDGAGGAAASAPPPRVSSRDQVVRISAEAGVAFFHTGSEGQFPKSEFRVDDPVIAVEAPVWKDVYFFTELKLLPRETNEEQFELGEMYVDFENVSAAWGRPDLLSVRVGRLNIPFGEEYLARGPVANPLISHSLSDVWGVDEGVEIYGRVGPLQYVAAVQNGGVSRLRDFNADKSVTARVGGNPAPWLHLSGSAMRTGEIATVADNLSEVWFGNGFFRALGPSHRTTAFWASLYQADATARWAGGHLGLALGHARYDDSDPLVDNARRIRFGYGELVQTIAGGLYGAARHSRIRAPRGYPLAGWGQMGAFFFRPGVLTEELERTSIGFGYRFGPPLVLKMEYAWENGRLTTGVKRDKEDFFGTELGVRF